MRSIFSSLSGKTKKRVDLTGNDKLFLKFLARHKYCDETAAKILYQKSEQTFWRRMRKLKKYQYIRKNIMPLQSPLLVEKNELLNIFSLDSAGCKMYETKKISGVNKLGILFKHDVFIKRLCAVLEILSQGHGFSFKMEFMLDDFIETQNIYIKDDNKMKIRPDIYIPEYKLAFEIETNIKHNINRYGRRLFWSQWIKNLEKTIWFVDNENDKNRLINNLSHWSLKQFKYDKILDSRMIFSDTIDKNKVFVFNEFLENYENNFEIIK